MQTETRILTAQKCPLPTAVGARHGAPTRWKDGVLGARQSAKSGALVGEVARG